MGTVVDLNGSHFGRLAVHEFAGIDKYHRATFRCVCACGVEKVKAAAELKSGRVLSCGCLNSENTIKRQTKHGGASGGKHTPEYTAFYEAQRRCKDTKFKQYADYGGRGIKFLFTSFEQFFAELGSRPEGKTLDRKDNDGNYEPGNVQWATRSEQQHNQRRSAK